MIVRSVVVLPQPLGPSRVRISPRRTSKLSPSTAVTVPNAFVTSRSAKTSHDPSPLAKLAAAPPRSGRGRRDEVAAGEGSVLCDKRVLKLALGPGRILRQVHLRRPNLAALPLRADRITPFLDVVHRRDQQASHLNDRRVCAAEVLLGAV